MGIFYRRFIFGVALLVSTVQVAFAEDLHIQYRHGTEWLTCGDSLSRGYHKPESSVYGTNFYMKYIGATNAGNVYVLDKSSGSVIATLNGAADTNLITGSFCPAEYSETIKPSDYVHNPSDFVEAPTSYTEEQCADFGGQTGDSVAQTKNLAPNTSCYKGCVVEEKLFGDFWTVGNMEFSEHEFTGGTCISEKPEEEAGCVIDQDGYGNWSKLCVIPPDADVADYPDVDPQPTDDKCLIAYDADGNAVSSVCNQQPGTCWYDSGQFYCAGEEYSDGFSCTKIDEFLACSYEDPNTGSSTPIDPDSVDHPANGGNADGDLTNDVFEPTPEGTVSGGGYGYGSSGTYVQDSPTASQQYQTRQITDSIAQAQINITDSLGVASDNITDSVTQSGDQVTDAINYLPSAFEGAIGSGQLDGTVDPDSSSLAVDNLGNGIITTINDSKIGQLTGQFQSAFSGNTGTCPDFSFTIDFLNIGQIGTDMHCQLTTDYAALISGLMFFLYAVISFRIVMGA